MGFSVAGLLGLTGAAQTAVGVGISAIGAAGLSAGAGALLSKRPNMPPSPVMPQAGVNETAAAADQASQRRQSIAGGLPSTLGTPGGQAGSMLDPSNMGQKTLLGA